MGYYENPPIINFTEGYNKVTEGIISASRSISEALIRRGERERLTIEKLQQQKNEVDLAYNSKLSEWDAKTPIGNDELNSKIHGLLQQKIQLAADSRIALLSETDNAKRAEYLKHIRNADVFMSNASTFAKNIAMDTATWRENAAAITVGAQNGWVVNGKDAKEIEARTGAVEILGGLNQLYDDHSIDIEDTGDSFKLKIKGKRKGSEEGFELPIDARSYISSDEGGAGGFLQKVENLDEFTKMSKKNLVDDKGNLKENFLSQNIETAKINNQYQIVYGQRLDTEGIRKEIQKQASIKASGYLRADKEASLRSLLNYTLKQGPEFYDTTFKVLETVEQKQAMLTELLTNQSFNSITSDLHRTKEGDNTVYWGPSSQIDLIEPTKPNKNDKNPAGPTSSSNAGTTIDPQNYDLALKAYDNAAGGSGDKFDVILTGPKGGSILKTFEVLEDKDGKNRIFYNNVSYTREDFRKFLNSYRRPALTAK
jgi:hypothetical protein